MKPKNWLADLAKGMFWLPEKPEHQVPGIIVNRDGRLRLELIGTFSEDSAVLQGAFYPHICGWLSNGGELTLLTCSSSVSFNAPGMSTEQSSFAVALKGRHFEALSDLVFDQVGVHFSGLSDWIGVSGLDTRFDASEDGKRVWTARYVQPVSIDYRRPDGMFLSFHSTASFPGECGRFDVALMQECTVTLKYPSEAEISALREDVHELQLLLRLFSGLELEATYDFVCNGRFRDGERDQRLPIFLNQRKPRQEVVKPKTNFAQLDTFVPFSEVRADFDKYLERWSAVRRKYGAAVDASLVNVVSMTLENRFLNLVNSLHRYAEVDAGRRLRLDQVLPMYLDPYCREAVASKALTLIKHTRHYYTHYSSDFVDKAADGADLANAVELLDILNRCALLERLGIDRECVRSWVADSRTFREYLHMNRWKALGS
jgi:hypothetical protein